jgi:haloacid dehalogenase superfamily, subfamily IA, variant 1 with third motif having Dx(3-4)D or Dx(3-4)E
MIKALIFDVYGTLIDTKDGSIKATSLILKKNHSNLDPKVVYSKWKMYHSEHIRESSAFLNEEEIFLKDMKRLYVDFEINGNEESDISIMLNSLNERDVFPETKDVLERLRAKYNIYIGSNTDTVPLVLNLKRNDIKVDGYFTSESLQVYKPKKDFFERILKQIGCNTDEVVYVGDSQVEDMLGAKALNIFTVWVNRKKQKLQENIPKPNYEILSLNNLFDFL